MSKTFFPVAITILILSFIGFTMYINMLYDNSCLEAIAEDNCKDNNLYYSSLEWRTHWIYFCNEYKNEISSRRFLITDREIEECKE